MQTMSDKIDADIIIVGGGSIGLTQAILLARGGFSVICLDRDKADGTQTNLADARTTAISYGSHQLMKAADVWDQLLPHACPIMDIEIYDGNSPVLMDFANEDIDATDGDNAFGWVIENKVIKQVLFSAIAAEKNIKHITGSAVQNFKDRGDHITVMCNDNKNYNATLIIGADGRQSFTREWMNVGAREWAYNQTALITMITHEKPHHNIAIEHFMPEGPFAILPLLDDEQGNPRSTLIWTQHDENNKKVLQYDDETFLIALNTRFPELYGQITHATTRLSYPLSFIHAYSYIAPRMVLIGDAAHGIHPIAGQGLNLGLRDVAALSEILMNAKKDNKDIGGVDILQSYQAARRPDNMAMAITTDLLNKLFSNNRPTSKLARKIGLKIINRLQPTKRFFMRQAMGTSGHLPKIIKGEKI